MLTKARVPACLASTEERQKIVQARPALPQHKALELYEQVQRGEGVNPGNCVDIIV